MVRQKIDEANTPFQYLSESEYESGADSDGAASNKSCALPKAGFRSDGESVKHSWEAVQAKLRYHQHLQEQNPPEPIISIDNNSEGSDLVPHIDLGSKVAAECSSDVSIIAPSVHTADTPGIGMDLPSASYFKDKRASHYSEYKVLQALRSRAMEEDEDEAGDNDDS